MPLALVTGGTGFVGREVVRELVSLGFAVRLLVRDPRSKEAAALAARHGKAVGFAVGSLSDPASLEAACAGADAVVHLVGIIAEKGRQTFERVHAEGTRNVVRAAEKARVSRYVHMSALGTGPEARAPYQRTKWEAEEIVRGSSLAWTIFRPSVIFGPRDGFVNQLAAMLRFPLAALQLYAFPLIGGGASLLQPVSVEDVARAFARSVGHADAVGKTYDLAGPERLSLRAILGEIGAAQGKAFAVEGFPPWLLVLRGWLWAMAALLPFGMLFVFWTYSWLIPALNGAAAMPRPEPKIPLSALLIPAAGAWIVSLVVALRWHRIIFFRLPWPLASAVGTAMEKLLPHPPLTSGQVTMLKTDNVGDALPAAAAFGLLLHPFGPGIRAYLHP